MDTRGTALGRFAQLVECWAVSSWRSDRKVHDTESGDLEPR